MSKREREAWEQGYRARTKENLNRQCGTAFNPYSNTDDPQPVGLSELLSALSYDTCVNETNVVAEAAEVIRIARETNMNAVKTCPLAWSRPDVIAGARETLMRANEVIRELMNEAAADKQRIKDLERDLGYMKRNWDNSRDDANYVRGKIHRDLAKAMDWHTDGIVEEIVEAAGEMNSGVKTLLTEAKHRWGIEATIGDLLEKVAQHGAAGIRLGKLYDALQTKEAMTDQQVANEATRQLLKLRRDNDAIRAKPAPVPFVRELTDEEIQEQCRVGEFQFVPAPSTLALIRRCIALATKLPEGSISATTRVTSAQPSSMSGLVCSIGGGEHGTLHQVFIPDTPPTKRTILGGQEIDVTEAELREALDRFKGDSP